MNHYVVEFHVKVKASDVDKAVAGARLVLQERFSREYLMRVYKLEREEKRER